MPGSNDPAALSAVAARDAIRGGALSPVALVDARAGARERARGGLHLRGDVRFRAGEQLR